MTYLKKQWDSEGDNAALVNLSRQDDKLRASPSCDFCGDSVPAYVYASSRMSTGETRQCWRWTACIKCARMVDHGNWDALQRRVAARFKALFALKIQTLENKYKSPVSDSLISEAVQTSLQQFHDYAVHVMETGTGKTGGNDNAKG